MKFEPIDDGTHSFKAIPENDGDVNTLDRLLAGIPVDFPQIPQDVVAINEAKKQCAMTSCDIVTDLYFKDGHLKFVKNARLPSVQRLDEAIRIAEREIAAIEARAARRAALRLWVKAAGILLAMALIAACMTSCNLVRNATSHYDTSAAARDHRRAEAWKPFTPKYTYNVCTNIPSTAQSKRAAASSIQKQ